MSQQQKTLEALARIAGRFGLTVWQWQGHGSVGTHAPGSLHYQTFPNGEGCAFDAFGPSSRMAAFSWYLRLHRGMRKQLTEGIYNGGFKSLSVKNGQNVPSSYWGPATWASHTNHVHIGIAP
jgi:hypothetical protein